MLNYEKKLMRLAAELAKHDIPEPFSDDDTKSISDSSDDTTKERIME